MTLDSINSGMNPPRPRLGPGVALWLAWAGLRWLAHWLVADGGAIGVVIETGAVAAMLPAVWLWYRFARSVRWWEAALVGLGAWALIWTVLAATSISAAVQQAVGAAPAAAGMSVALALMSRPAPSRTDPSGPLRAHFLRNVVHSASVLVPRSPAKAVAALEHLGEMLGHVLRAGESATVSLGDELAFVESYLALERLRYGERLRSDITAAGETYRFAVPSLCIQPLVENAVRHGVAREAGPTRVTVDVQLDAGFVVIRVTDDGKGATLDQVTRSKGRGLRLLAGRLEAGGARGSSMTLETSPSTGFTATLRLPARVDPKDRTDERFSIDSR